MSIRRVTIIGAGVVGSAVGFLLRRRGYDICGLYSRTRKSSRRAAEFIGIPAGDVDLAGAVLGSDLVFLTVPDRFIQPACRELVDGKGLQEGAVVIHTSGSLPSTVLNPVHDRGAFAASLHPLMSFASAIDAVEKFPGTFCGCESDPEVEPVLKQIVLDMGGVPVLLSPTDKALYHAAAVMASNFVVTLLAVATELLDVGRFGRSTLSIQALLPLVKSAIANVETLGLPGALTGPIARGDVEVVEAHVDAIARQAPRYLEVYRELARLTLSLALAKGTLDSAAAERLAELLQAAATSRS